MLLRAFLGHDLGGAFFGGSLWHFDFYPQITQISQIKRKQNDNEAGDACRQTIINILPPVFLLRNLRNLRNLRMI